MQRSGQLTQFQDLEREVVITPEPLTNKLLISATPRYMPDILRLIQELDAELPQVAIQVLIVEVSFSDTDEFGVEIGLQSPVTFTRGIYPAVGFGAASTTSYTTTATAAGTLPTGATVPIGVTVNNTTNPASALGFNFNNPGIGLGNNVAVNPGAVGFQGLGNLGVGRVSPTSGIGGFVFSAASDTFNLLVRALKQQGRLEVLSRPSIMTLDNQAAQVAIGQSFPYTQGSNVTATGVISNNVLYRDIGVILNVIPKIQPDGKVVMRVTPQITSVQPQLLALGGGVLAPIFNQQIVDTTVIARDGETIALGGLLTRSDSKTENKIPFVGDLPLVGALFRSRTQVKSKRELMVILTPHIVKCRADGERLLAMEGNKMDWTLSDVVKTQGAAGLHPLFPPAPAGPQGGVDGAYKSGLLPHQGPLLPIPTPPASPILNGAPLLTPANPVGTHNLPGPITPATPLPGDGLPMPRPVPPPPTVTNPTGGLMPLPGGTTALPPGAALPGRENPTTDATAVVAAEDRPLSGLSLYKAPTAGNLLPVSATVPAPAGPTGPTPQQLNAAPPAAQPETKEARRWGWFGK